MQTPPTSPTLKRRRLECPPAPHRPTIFMSRPDLSKQYTFVKLENDITISRSSVFGYSLRYVDDLGLMLCVRWKTHGGERKMALESMVNVIDSKLE